MFLDLFEIPNGFQRFLEIYKGPGWDSLQNFVFFVSFEVPKGFKDSWEALKTFRKSKNSKNPCDNKGITGLG
jgi:hypothetical protein